MGIGCMPLVLTSASFALKRCVIKSGILLTLVHDYVVQKNYPKLHWQNVNGHATIPNMIVLMNQVYTNYTLTIIRHSDWHT